MQRLATTDADSDGPRGPTPGPLAIVPGSCFRRTTLLGSEAVAAQVPDRRLPNCTDHLIGASRASSRAPPITWRLKRVQRFPTGTPIQTCPARNFEPQLPVTGSHVSPTTLPKFEAVDAQLPYR